MKKIIVFSILFLFFIPSFIFGGEWEIHGQLVQRISDAACVVKLSQETCDYLNHDNLVWVGGGHSPEGPTTDFWAIYDMTTGECLWSGNMLDPRQSFSVVEIENCRLLIISGINSFEGEISSCEILDLRALINSNFTLSTYTDSVEYPASYTSAITLTNEDVLWGGGAQSAGYRWQIYDLNTMTWGSIFYSQIGRLQAQLKLDNISGNVIAMDGNISFGSIEILLADTEQWILGPEIPYPVRDSRCQAVSDSETVLTGGDGWDGYSNQTILYNSVNNTVSELEPFNLACCKHGAVWIRPSQKLFIGGGSVPSSSGGTTKSCYSSKLPVVSWTIEGDLKKYRSWTNFFLTKDYRIFAIGNYVDWVELYPWNHTPFLIDYSYASTSTPPTANVNVEVHDPDLDSIATRFIFVENGDSTETAWSEYRPSGSLFSVEHEWGSSTSSHEVICEMKDIYAPWNVHNSFADSTLIVNIGVDPDPGYPEPMLVKIAPHPVRENTVIHFTIQRPAEVKIDLYNLKGQLIETLFANPCSLENYEIEFNAQNLAGGMYFLKIETETEILYKKMVLIN